MPCRDGAPGRSGGACRSSPSPPLSWARPWSAARPGARRCPRWIRRAPPPRTRRACAAVRSNTSTRSSSGRNFCQRGSRRNRRNMPRRGIVGAASSTGGLRRQRLLPQQAQGRRPWWRARSSASLQALLFAGVDQAQRARVESTHGRGRRLQQIAGGRWRSRRLSASSTSTASMSWSCTASWCTASSRSWRRCAPSSSGTQQWPHQQVAQLAVLGVEGAVRLPR